MECIKTFLHPCCAGGIWGHVHAWWLHLSSYHSALHICLQKLPANGAWQDHFGLDHSSSHQVSQSIHVLSCIVQHKSIHHRARLKICSIAHMLCPKMKKLHDIIKVMIKCVIAPNQTKWIRLYLLLAAQHMYRFLVYIDKAFASEIELYQRHKPTIASWSPCVSNANPIWLEGKENESLFKAILLLNAHLASIGMSVDYR